MKIDPPKEVDSGFDITDETVKEDREPIPYTQPTILFDQQTVKAIDWEKTFPF